MQERKCLDLSLDNDGSPLKPSGIVKTETDEKKVDDLDGIILDFDPFEYIDLSFEEAFHRRQTLCRGPFNHLRARPLKPYKTLTPIFFFLVSFVNYGQPLMATYSWCFYKPLELFLQI